MMPVHPGELLREKMETLNISMNAFSKAPCVSVRRIALILNGQRGVSADTALRLARLFWRCSEFVAESAEKLGAAPGGD